MEFAWNTQKNKLTDIKGLQMEQDREGKINNKEIDINKTNLNYDLADKEMNSHTNLYHRVKKRIEDVREVSRVQKNSVVDYSNIITVSKEQSEKWGIDKTKDYFKEAYNYFCDEFGKENVVSAKVHLDETAPHMHLHFVPVNLENGKLQSSKVVNPIRVNQIHTNAPKYLRSKGFEVERGIGKTKENLDIHEFKEKKLNERINELEKEIDLKNNKIKSLMEIESEIKNIDEIKLDKNITRKKLLIAPNEFELLKNNYKKLKVVESENNKLKINMKNNDNENIRMKNDIEKLNLKVADDKELILKLIEKENTFKIFDRVLNKNLNLKKDFIISLGLEKEKINYENKFEKLFGDVKIKILKSDSIELKENKSLKLKELNSILQNNFEENKVINVGFIPLKLAIDLNLNNKDFYKLLSEQKEFADGFKKIIKINEKNLKILNSLGGYLSRNNDVKNEINMQKSSKNISKKETFGIEL